MKTIILTTLMVLTVSTVHAAKDCGATKQNAIRELSSAAEEIEAQTAKDERVEIDRTAPEYKALNAIGVVIPADMTSYGSGFLVDSCHVLTNNHVVFKKGQAQKNGAKVTFSVGQTGSKEKPFTHALIDGKVIAHGEYEHTLNSANNDWAIIRLSKSVGKEIDTIPFFQMDVKHMKGRQVITAGYPGSRTQNGKDLSAMYGDKNCKIIGMSIYGYVQHTCQVTPGQSGSPALALNKDNGKYYAIGMVGGDADFDGLDRSEESKKANIAVSFDSGKSDGVVSQGDLIASALKSDKCD